MEQRKNLEMAVPCYYSQIETKHQIFSGSPFSMRLGIFLENDFSSDDGNSESYQRSEEEADQFAKDFLIRPEDYQAFVEKGNFNKTDIIRFAEEIDIHPSVVLGRLQNEGILSFDRFRELKENYYFVS